ncbi:PREDICTED: metabotropic glutamate receptor 2-like [Acropora digitifera]|uniref:metabotropic glutamate receptor 2-like n=1 Tax=Acropora digitifera TaxID=70779 RepID=UPI00077A06C1|nr:PREDICTED: metabotropic glutamate receptor 2-like [Acropora digitifera]
MMKIKFQNTAENPNTQMKRVRVMVQAIAIFMASGFTASAVQYADKSRSYKPGDVILGGLFLLHYSTDEGHCGDLFPIGLGHVEAMVFAINKINDNPKLLPNVTLGFDIRDYCEIITKAMKHSYDFVRRNEMVLHANNGSCNSGPNSRRDESRPIAAVIGPTDSGSAIVVGSLLEVAGIPVISHSATSNELSSAQYRHFFRTAPPDNQQARAMADIIEHFNWSYVAVVAMEDSYGRNGARKVETEAEKRQTFCVAFSEFIPRQNYSAKLVRVVKKVKHFPNVRVVLLWLFGSYGRRFLKEVVKHKLGDRTWILSDALATEDDVFVGLDDEEQNVVHGSLGVQPRHLTRDQHFESFVIHKSKKNEVIWWEELLKQTNNQGCPFTELYQRGNGCQEMLFRSIYDTYIPYVIDAVDAVAHAIHQYLLENCDPFKGHSSSLGNRCRDALRLIDLQAVERNIVWNTLESQASMITPKSFCHEDCTPGTFQSKTTPCCFECIKCPVGTLSTEPNSFNCTECPQGQFPDESRSKCFDLPEVELAWSSTTSVLVILFGTVGMALVALCGVILYKHRKTPIIKAANRELSLILLIAIFLSFIVSILSLAKPTNSMCGSRIFLRSTLLTTFISILILKTIKLLSAFRINIVAEGFKKFILTAKSQSLLVLALLSLHLVFLLFWFALDPPRQKRTTQQMEGTILLSCLFHHSPIGKTFQIAITIYTSFLAIVCTVYAFKARSLPENFNEARYIAFSMYILLLSAVAYYPLDIGLSASHATNLTAAGTLLSSYGLLGCMFAPKIYVIFQKPEQNTVVAVSSQVSEFSFCGNQRNRISIA